MTWGNDPKRVRKGRGSNRNRSIIWLFRLTLAMLVFSVFIILSESTQALAQIQSDETQSVTNKSQVDPKITEKVLANLLIPLTRPELESLTKSWLSIVAAKTKEVADAQIALLGRQGSSAEYQALAMLVEERAQLFIKYNLVVTAYEKKGGDPKWVEELRAYRNTVISDEAGLASPKALFTAALTWLTRPDGGLRILGSIALLLLFACMLLLIAGLARRIARRWIGRVDRMSHLLQDFSVGAVYWIVLALGLLLVLSGLGVDITPLYAMIGGASFILAFAFQDTLSNLANGLMIMINKPFDSGDYVDVGGVGGTIQSVSIVATTIITPDNQVIVIPNKNVWGSTITNVTASETRRVDLIFGISYEDEIPHALEVIKSTVHQHPEVLDEPEPIIRVNELAENSVNIICRPWAKTDNYWTVYWDLTQQVKEAFDDAQISIPYPQRDVHLKQR